MRSGTSAGDPSVDCSIRAAWPAVALSIFFHLLLMGSLSSELINDHRPSLSRTIGGIFIDVLLSSSDPVVKLSDLDDLVSRLEDEMLKINGLTCELPLCILFITRAIADLKEEKASTTSLGKRVTANLNADCDECKHQKLGRLDLQLKPPNPHRYVNLETKADVQISCNGRNGGREITRSRPPFSPLTPTLLQRKENKVELSPHSDSLLTPEMRSSKPTPIYAKPLFTQSGQSSSSPHQITRKQRRCWSHDLHEKFVHALQQLGGSKAATPKQIREIMQVNGLTNDEVKSHLQKYRLHTRKLRGSLSLDQSEDDAAVPKGSTSQSGSSQGRLHLCGSAVAASPNGGDSVDDE